MSTTYETDGPEFERDWHQEDKDNRAQGFDRDPEPPEDEPLLPGLDEDNDQPWGELSDEAPF